MLEKLSIRFVTSLIFMWYIFQMTGIVIYIDVYIFLMMILFSMLVTLLIESLYSLLRHLLRWTPYLLLGMIVSICLFFHFAGGGIYLGLLVYTLISVGIQLYREYKMEKLLNVALDNWNKNDTIE